MYFAQRIESEIPPKPFEFINQYGEKVLLVYTENLFAGRYNLKISFENIKSKRARKYLKDKSWTKFKTVKYASEVMIEENMSVDSAIEKAIKDLSTSVFV